MYTSFQQCRLIKEHNFRELRVTLPMATVMQFTSKYIYIYLYLCVCVCVCVCVRLCIYIYIYIYIYI